MKPAILLVKKKDFSFSAQRITRACFLFLFCFILMGARGKTDNSSEIKSKQKHFQKLLRNDMAATLTPKMANNEFIKMSPGCKSKRFISLSG